MRVSCRIIIAALLLASCTSCPKTAEVSMTVSPQEETVAYSLQVKGAEAAGVAPDDITMVSKFYQDIEDMRGAGEFVQKVATGNFGNDTYGWKPMVAGIPASSHTVRN